MKIIWKFKIAVAIFLLAFASGQAAYAIMPDRQHASDITRFGLNNPEPAWKGAGAPSPKASVARVRALAAQGIRVGVHPQGLVSSMAGQLTGPQIGTPDQLARQYVAQNRDILGIDPAALSLDSNRQAGGITHLLYRQTYNGLPVEFGRVKVHVSDRGEVLGVDSGYITGVNASAIPAVSAASAASAIVRDLGGSPPQGGTLVYLPVYRTGAVRLAWRFKVSGGGALWQYYVDAQTGEILFRINALNYACATSGTVTGQVYALDNRSAPVSRPIANQNVYVYGSASPDVTAGDGSFCSATAGKISAALQGPYVGVSHANLTTAHYDNGNGFWFTPATPLSSSPQPYPNGAGPINSIVFTGTIVSPTPPAPYSALNVVAAMPHFSSFAVGSVDSQSGLILDDDQLRVVGPNGTPVAYYVGNKSAFSGAAVQGLNPSITLQLVANLSGQNQGFSVNISSFLVLPNAPTVAGAGSTFQWVSTMTADSTLDEINVFYHINTMHDYFMADVDKTSAAYISNPTVAVVHASNLSNAFYNPDFDNLTFGDALPFALDATVSHHEYTHFVVEKIYPVINFGQSGAISEADADYFSASSLNDPNIGAGVAATVGDVTLRNLACGPPSSNCLIFPASWNGEIHDDSRPLGQALWEMHEALKNSSLGSLAGPSCADELVFQTLFYFPDSFEEYLNGILQVAARSAGMSPATAMAPSCAALSLPTLKNIIITPFAYHFPTLTGVGDAYEPNDGPQTATNITTMPVITATIYPKADQDYYTFGAGPGPIRAVLTLPADPGNPTAHFAYAMALLDRQLNIVSQASPAIDVNPTLGGNCPLSTNPGCETTQSSVVLSYNNSSPNQFYLLVAGAADDAGSISPVNSPLPYTLQTSYSGPSALSASIVTASFDHDTIQFSVDVSSFVRFQNYAFASAQLRDQAENVLAQTAASLANPAPYLSVTGISKQSNGNITGTLKLMPGFANRFPAVGTVYVEVFGSNALQQANGTVSVSTAMPFLPQSLGLSNSINLTSNESALSAWNNIFNPMNGQKTTIKYETASPGHVTINLYTMNGAKVLTLLDGDMPAGKGSVDWDGRSSAGRTVASGIYLIHLDGPGVHKTEKAVVVK